MRHSVLQFRMAIDRRTKKVAPTGIRFRQGTIVSVGPVTTTDGKSQVTVQIGADNIDAPYLAGYTPAAKDRVLVALVDGVSPVIMDRVVGFPTY